MTTLISLVTRSLNGIGSLVVPTSLFGNEDDFAKQIIAFAIDIGEELTRDHDFQERIKVATVTTVAGTDNYALEADYDRFVSDTSWDSTTKRKMSGNTSSAQWAAITNSSLQVSVTHWWRLKGNRIYVAPTPTSAWSFNYEYRSKYYCSSNAGTEQSQWLADNDVWLLPDDLFVAGMKYYVRKENQLPFADAEAVYNSIIARREATNVPSPVIDLGASVRQPRSVTATLNIPDYVSE